MRGKTAPTEAAARAAKRRRLHGDRCDRRRGKARFEAAREWLMAEASDTDRFAATQAWDDAADAVAAVARELNGRRVGVDSHTE